MSEGPFIPRALPAKIEPYDWPQDQMSIPNGFGIMPRIDFSNEYQTKQEGFCYSTHFTAIPVDGTVTKIIPTDPDGDFWCSTVYYRAFINGTQTEANRCSKIQIEDIRTGITMFFPFGRICIFRTNPITFRQGGFIQPFCFTRHGGIKMSITNDNNNSILDYFVTFAGWKEYQYASR